LGFLSVLLYSAGMQKKEIKPMNTQAKDKDITEKAYFKIDENGQWFHNGEPIKRSALAKLFADKGLRVDENGRYWLQSPYEKYPVEVVDSPFIIIDYSQNTDGLDLIANMGDVVPLGPDHPMVLRDSDVYNMKLPYVHVRGGLYARLSRNVYHAMVHQYGASVYSRGHDYLLGEVETSL